jgi:hypothetical protein
MPGSNGFISIKGDVKHSYNCDWGELSDGRHVHGVPRTPRSKEVLGRAASPPPPDQIMPEFKTSMFSWVNIFAWNLTDMPGVPRKLIKLGEPSKVAHVCNNLDPK